MTDLDINQTCIISIYCIQNTSTEILSVCSSLPDMNNMMSFDGQDIHKLVLDLEPAQLINFFLFYALW